MSYYGPPQGAPPGQWGPPPPPPPRNYGDYYPPQGPPPEGHYHQGGQINNYTPSDNGYGPPSGPPPSWGGGGGGGGGYPGQEYREDYGTQTAYNDNGQNYGGGGYNQYGPPPGPPPMPPSQVQNYGPQFDQGGQTAQPYFQYSQCNGRRKALCIGINYYGSQNELKGCVNDANNMRNFLCRQFGYEMDDIVLLSDDQQNARAIPTRDNILAAMQWLVRDAQPNDSLFFHYSGHGGQTPDLDGDEDDGYDEVIYPVDFQQAGQIVDDDMFFIMVKPLPPGCRITAIFDSCHSGSALDLPYVYSTEGKIKEPNLLAEAGQGLLQAGLSYARGDMGGLMQNAMSLFKTATGKDRKAEQVARQTRTAPCDAISFSGCKDSQTSADTVEAGQATGAMSYGFVKVLTQNPQQSYQGLLVALREVLANEYSQKPQLSSSHPIDTNLMFIA